MELEKIKSNEIKMEIINEKHNISEFKSYEKELVQFLREDAINDQEQKLSLTFY